MHAGNALVNFIDLLVHAHPAYFGHVIYVFGGGFLYLIFCLVYTYGGGTDRDGINMIYPEIDFKNNLPSATIFVVQTLFMLSMMHFVLTAIVHLRVFVYVLKRKLI